MSQRKITRWDGTKVRGLGSTTKLDEHICAPIVATPAAGGVNSGTTVALSCSTSGSAIRFTTNGTNPTESSGTVYSSAISVTADTTIKAIAYKTGLASNRGVFDYTVAGISLDLIPAWEDLTPDAPLLEEGDFARGDAVAKLFAGLSVVDVSSVAGFTHRYLMAFSTDHEFLTPDAGVWFAGSNDLLTWYPLNSANRLAVLNGTEFPDLIVDGSTLYCFTHKFNGGTPDNQATFVCSSTNGLNFGTLTEALHPGLSFGHTGYSQAWYQDGEWKCHSNWGGAGGANAVSCYTRWTAPSPAGPWTHSGEYLMAWKYHIDGIGQKQAYGGFRYWDRGGTAKFVFANSSRWDGTAGTGADKTRVYQVRTCDNGFGVILPVREFHETSRRVGQWNSGHPGLTAKPIRHTDGRLYAVCVGRDGSDVRGVGLFRADENTEAAELTDYAGTAVDVFDASGQVHVGDEYLVRNAADGLSITPSTSANGTLSYDSGTGLYTVNANTVGASTSVHFPGYNADFSNDLEITLEIFGLLNNHEIADLFWQCGVNAAAAGALFGYFTGSVSTVDVKTYGSSPATTITTTTCNRGFNGMDILRAEKREKWTLGIRPNLGHVWLILDDWHTIVALTPSSSVMGRTGTSLETMMTLIPRVAARSWTFHNMRLTRRR